MSLGSTITMTTMSSSPVEVSPLLNTSDDVFLRILQRLSTQDVRNLSLASKSLANSPWILHHLWQAPFRANDFITHHYLDRSNDEPPRPGQDGGRARFRQFVAALTRRQDCGVYLRRMALPHYARLMDFELLEKRCPNLHSLDLSHIADEYFGIGYSWEELVRSRPTLFRRLKFLKVDVGVHTWPAPELRSTRIRETNTRNFRDGGLKLLLQASPHLETLALVGPHGRSWTRAECQDEISEAIASGAAGSRLTTLQLWDMGSCIRSFRGFLEPLTHLEHLQTIAVNFTETLHFFTRDGVVEDYARRRDTRKGIDSLYTSTTKNLFQYLSEMKEINDQGRWKIISLDRGGIEVRHDPRTLYPLVNEPGGFELLAFMKAQFGWTPVLAWEGVIHPSYPTEHTSLSCLLSIQRAVELATLEELLKRIRALDIPITVELSAEHTRSRSFFGCSSQATSTEDWFLNDRLAPLIDELRITYGDDDDDEEEGDHPVMIRPGRLGDGTREHWHGKKRNASSSASAASSTSSASALPNTAYQAEDALAFRSFWRIFAERFTGVKCLKVSVPGFMFRNWTERELEEILAGVDARKKWEVVTRRDDIKAEVDGLEDRVRAVYCRVLH